MLCLCYVLLYGVCEYCIIVICYNVDNVNVASLLCVALWSILVLCHCYVLPCDVCKCCVIVMCYHLINVNVVSLLCVTIWLM